MNNDTSPNISITSLQRIVLWIIILSGLFGMIYLIRGILLPFIVGIIIAYALSPIVQILQRFKINRPFGSFLTLLSFFMGFGSLFAFAFPYAQAEIIDLAIHIPTYGVQLHAQAMDFLKELSSHIPQEDWLRLKIMGKSYIGDALSWVAIFMANLLTSSLALANILALIFITPIVSFYFLKDWPKILLTLKSWIPTSYSETILTQVNLIDRALAGFARGQAIVCLSLATYYATALSLAGLESGLAIGLLTGFFTFIPYVGILTGCCISMILAFVQFDLWSMRLLIFGIFVVGQILEGNFLTPLLVGERIGLHPVWVIFAIFSGAYLMGLVGIIIALPVAAIFGVLLRFGLKKYLASPLYKTIPHS